MSPRYRCVLALLLPLGLALGSIPRVSHAAVGGMTVGGCIYTGDGTVSYTLNAVGEPVAHWSTNYNTAPITNAEVMVQNQHSGGQFVVYGSTGLGAGGNCWEAAIPDSDSDGTPDTTDLIVMFSAPGHAATSRQFTWDAALAEFTYPTGPEPAAANRVTGADCASEPGQCLSVAATGAQDAYLAPVPEETANLLHYVFYDQFTNGGDDGALIDPGLNGVTINVFNEAGDLVASQQTGELALGPAGGFTTTDGLVFNGALAYGAVYITGLPSGNYHVESDPSTVTQALNPHFALSMAHPADSCSTAGRVDYDQPGCNWYQTYTEEAGHEWEAPLRPGDPGTEAGGYMTWHGFIEKIGPDGGGGPGISGTIMGTLVDADGNDAVELFPQVHGGRVPPTNARFEDGTPWNINSNPIPGLPGTFLTFDILANARVENGLVALHSVGDFPRLVATAVATPTGNYNDPTGSEFTFTNVPPGQYEIFAFDRDLSFVAMIGNGVSVVPGGVSLPVILVPRFGSRAAGFVMNNGAAVPNAKMNISYKSGAVKKTATSNGNGWFVFQFLPETEALGQAYLDLQDGDTIRGKIISEDWQNFDQLGTDPACAGSPPPCLIYSTATHNAMSRYIQWATINYFVDIQVEDIPATVGNVFGAVFNDNFAPPETATDSWVGNGVWDQDEERTFSGETVELYPTVAVPGSPPLCDPTATPVAVSTGSANDADLLRMGWTMPYTYPLNELGTVLAGPVTFDGSPPAAPANGFYEFRDVAPGDYCLRVVPKPGFQHSPDVAVEPMGFKLVHVTGGQNRRVDLGVQTRPTVAWPSADSCVIVPPATMGGSCSLSTNTYCRVDSDCPGNGSTTGVPLAGEMEGGVFSGNGDLDPNPTGLWFDESWAIVGAPVGAYDQFNYFLGVGYQGDPYCHAFNNALHVPGASRLKPWDPNYDRFSCSSTTALEQKPEMERRFAPNVLRYNGNDPAFRVSGFDPTLPAWDFRWDSMELPSLAPQGAFKFEFAWTPLSGGSGITIPMCAVVLEGASFPSETWGATVNVTISDGYSLLTNAVVRGTWTSGPGGLVGGENAECVTDGNGRCSMVWEKVVGGETSVTLSLDTVSTTEAPWYVYDPDPVAGPLQGICRASTTVLESGGMSLCDDGIDNDGDGLADWPADPGCINAADTSEHSAVACDDGIDNDGDGFADWPADPGCRDLLWFTEAPECNDGIDNDADGLVDMADPQCLDPSANREGWVRRFPACGLGTAELALLLVPLIWMRRRGRARS